MVRAMVVMAPGKGVKIYILLKKTFHILRHPNFVDLFIRVHYILINLSIWKRWN